MSDLVEKAEDLAAEPGRLSRRTLVGRVAKVSLGLVAGAAGLASLRGTGHFAVAAGAYEQYCDWLNAPPLGCCSLAHLDHPDYFCSSVLHHGAPCPGGCVRSSSKEKYCRDENGATWVCGECGGCANTCSYAYILPRY